MSSSNRKAASAAATRTDQQCEECARLHAERRRAAVHLDWSQVTDCVVLLRRHAELCPRPTGGEA
ncbi:hypothetical protein GL263_25300 [Streptomyces durbertensis]|uniref:Uncharacterized protein n=1 Tax=Streptomyces durbertensis TaxID=2448886 RepID=A0ABR6ENC3_9ACTN|nr:hypothetical protein [Streptomyces durbertensis]MBB1246841.1 hypothetical protein [Streptomyces durbertensis]